jgi:hypothetical protein
LGDQTLVVNLFAAIAADQNVVTSRGGSCKSLHAVSVRPASISDVADLVVQNLDSVAEIAYTVIVATGRVIYLGVLQSEIVSFKLDAGGGRIDDVESLDDDIAGINTDPFNRGVAVTCDDDRSILSSRDFDI